MDKKILELLPERCEAIKTDSRLIEKGDLFVAIKGSVDDGHEHVVEALERGASAVLTERSIDGLKEKDAGKLLLVEDTREVLAEIAKKVFKDPSQSIPVYGVTGTNGKTTTVFLIESILTSSGTACGIISTVFNKTRGEELEASKMTTPDVLTVNSLLLEMIQTGKGAAALEVSSHALSQKRTLGVDLESACFTNISPEHLDYHVNMENYLQDKAKIFTLLKEGGTAVINADDPLVAGLKESLKSLKVVTFGVDSEATVRAEEASLSEEGSEFDLSIEGMGKVHIKSSLIGKHNVSNMLAAASSLISSGVTVKEIKEGIERMKAVPGRLEAVESTSPFKVFVDYAHTPEALEKVLDCLLSLRKKRLICVFGCGGDRDRTKRPVMGRIATDKCDKVIITSDNPRTEKEEDILKEIEKGVINKNNYSIIKSRREAIREALQEASGGDIVLIAGKGHEDYQIMGEEIIHFDDSEEAKKALKSLGYK